MVSEPNNNTSLAWVEYDPRALKERRALGVYNQQRRVVRAHVAHTSSGARQATIARKVSIAKALGPKKATKAPKKSISTSKEQARADKIAYDSISRLFSRLRSRDAHAIASMAQKSDRILLWNAFTGGTICFEAAMFVAGTFANTCGISRHELHTGFGSGLLFLRGAFLDSIQRTIVHTPKDSFNSISLALLAGWERRFGDHQSYELHLQAWKNLPLAVGSLEDSSIAALADVAMICFQEATQERYSAEMASSLGRTHRPVLPVGLPPGFDIVPVERPEALSLLSLATEIASFDYTAQNSIADFRKLIIENMSWNASHSISASPDDIYEDQWDRLHMNVCYHIRSAIISINAPIMQACIEAHGVSWGFAIQQGIDIHAEACQHLKTHELMNTKYRDIAIWAKMTLISHATPTQSGDEHVRAIMKDSGPGIETWEQMESLLKRFVYKEELTAAKYRRLFDAL
jgi:hypothetical protein